MLGSVSHTSAVLRIPGSVLFHISLLSRVLMCSFCSVTDKSLDMIIIGKQIRFLANLL